MQVYFLCSNLIPKDFLMLAKVWNPNMNPLHWIISEKYDGYRVYWDGEKLWNRLGDPTDCPDWFKKLLPKFPIDGELWFLFCKFFYS
jgi:DNA ligase-1